MRSFTDMSKWANGWLECGLELLAPSCSPQLLDRLEMQLCPGRYPTEARRLSSQKRAPSTHGAMGQEREKYCRQPSEGGCIEAGRHLRRLGDRVWWGQKDAAGVDRKLRP